MRYLIEVETPEEQLSTVHFQNCMEMHHNGEVMPNPPLAEPVSVISVRKASELDGPQVDDLHLPEPKPADMLWRHSITSDFMKVNGNLMQAYAIVAALEIAQRSITVEDMQQYGELVARIIKHLR